MALKILIFKLALIFWLGGCIEQQVPYRYFEIQCKPLPSWGLDHRVQAVIYRQVIAGLKYSNVTQ